MKKSLLMLVGLGLIATSQLAMSADEELFRQRCEEQLIEDNIEQANHDEYMNDCIRYYQDIDLPIQDEPVDSEEKPDENSTKY